MWYNIIIPEPFMFFCNIWFCDCNLWHMCDTMIYHVTVTYVIMLTPNSKSKKWKINRNENENEKIK